MTIWSTEIKELETLYSSIKGRFQELEKELDQLIETKDANVVMLYSRRCLEIIVTDLCESELKRPRKTEPLKGIIDKLHREEKVPSNIITSMDHLNSLSTFGTHPKEFDPEQVKPVLNNLTTIIKWYLKYKEAQIDVKAKSEEVEDKSKRPDVTTEVIRKPNKSLILLLSGLFLVVLILAYPKIFKRDRLEKLRSSDRRISVAVMPFQNITNDTTWDVWQDGIQEHLTNSLSNSEELKIRQTESIKSLIQSKGLTNYASITPSFASTISQNLDANVFVYGNIIQAGTTIRVNAKLIDSKTEEVFKSFQIEGSSKEENIFQIIDSLSVQVKNFLLISKLKKEVRSDFQQFATTYSPEAYRYFIYGNNAFYKRDFPTACDWFLQAITVDSNFVGAMAKLSYAYGNQGLGEEARKWCLNAYEKKNLTSIQQKLFIDLLYATFFETHNEEIKFENRLLELDDQLPIIYYRKGLSYSNLYQYDKAIPEYEKALEIYNKWGSKPAWVSNYTGLGFVYHKMGQYKKERKLYKKAEQDFPDEPALIYRQAILSLTEGDSVTANEFIGTYISNRKDNSILEAGRMEEVADIYSQAGLLDKAEEYYREALSLEPENPVRLNNLAYFLINNDRNINEGLERIEKALELSPDNYNYLYTKGWGLYKQGKFNEALELLEKAWDLKPIYDYDHGFYLHIQEVKKAIAGQN